MTFALQHRESQLFRGFCECVLQCVNSHKEKAGSAPPALFRFCTELDPARSRITARLSKRGDALRQAGQLACKRILVKHAFGHAARHFWLRNLQRFGSSGLVTAFDRGFNFLDASADAAQPIGVDDRAPFIAADALTGLRRIGHVLSLTFYPVSGR